MKSILCTVGIFILSTQAVLAAPETVISQVELTKATDHVEYIFQLNKTVDASALSARLEDTLIVLSLKDATAKRTWIKSTSSEVRRILLHPLRSQSGAALRIRYVDSVSRSVLENIRVRAEGKRLIAAIPNSPEVAKAWAGHVAESTNKDVVVTKTDNSLEQKPVENLSPKDTEEEEIAIAPVLDDKTDSSMKSEAVEQPAKVENEAGIAATEGSNTPTLIVALLMMLGVGFVLFRKMKQMKPSNEGGPLIRPIGTHMLGPKQGLLLVDVAGERVLLGTTDKGVHLLTKLEGVADDAVERTYPHSVDEEPVQNTQTAENPFGKMLGQFREASSRLRGMTQPENSSTAKGTEDLALLAEDKPAYDRRLKRPVTPRVPVPPYETQTSIQERDALIEKLRMLKGA